MTHLTLKRQIPANAEIDLFNAVPSEVCGLDADAVGMKEILVDGAPQRLGDWFEVTNVGQEGLVLRGELQRCHRIAGNMQGGQLTVVGNVGDSLAEAMLSGELIVEGNAGRFAASGLRGGEVTVTGNVGDYAAAARVGAKHGMRGGTLVVRGHCGRWLGARMRRGTVIVQGNAAAGCGTRMIAGTIVLCADAQPPVASGMKRGTIIFAGDQPVFNCAGFNRPEKSELAFLTILLKEIVRLVPSLRSTCIAQPSVLRSIGDLADGGLGELIWLATKEFAD